MRSRIRRNSSLQAAYDDTSSSRTTDYGFYVTSLIYVYMLLLIGMNVFFFAHRRFFLFRPRVFSRALGSGARREPARTPRRRCSPGRGPWYVLWGFKVACNRGEAYRARKAIQAHANPRKYYKNVRRLMWNLGYWMSSISSDTTWWWKDICPTPTCETCDHF